MGGPVWHASIAYHARYRGAGERSPAIAAEREARARDALHGVGDAQLGEWVEHSPAATHIRRRLSDEEVAASGLTVVDIRRTPEAERRWALFPRDRRALIPEYIKRDEIG